MTDRAYNPVYGTRILLCLKRGSRGGSPIKTSLSEGGSICKHSVWISKRNSSWEAPDPCCRFARTAAKAEHQWHPTAQQTYFLKCPFWSKHAASQLGVSTPQRARYKDDPHKGHSQRRYVEREKEQERKRQSCGR